MLVKTFQACDDRRVLKFPRLRNRQTSLKRSAQMNPKMRGNRKSGNRACHTSQGEFATRSFRV